MAEQDIENQKPPAGLAALRKLDLEPSPFLAKRVEANWRAGRSEKKSSSWKLWLASATSFALALLLVTTVFIKKPSETAPASTYALNQPYMIRVDVRAISEADVAYAEILIEGDSARFSSKKFAEVAQNKRIVVAAEKLADKQYLPVVVEGVKAGDARVTINFRDVNDQVLSSKTLTLSFAGRSI